MATDEKVLELITNATIDSIKELDVVMPTMYSKLFSKFASTNNTVIENEEEIASYILDEKISQYTNLQEKTHKNTQKLSDNTDRAISAIKNKDDIILFQVLEETKALRKEIEKLKEFMHRDELTNVYNRRWLNDNLLQACHTKFNRSGTLAMIDLNYFKSINDNYGHIVGDKILIHMANQLRKANADIIRYGGDEFLLVFAQNVSKNDAISKLNEIRESVVTKKIKTKESEFKLSFSFGVQEFKTSNILTNVIDEADKKMYHDKISIKKRIPSI